MRVLFATLLLIDQGPVLLGSPEYQPSAARPFGFRGDGSGRFPGATPALEWSSTKNVRWSATVGKGYASPVLTNALVLILSEPGVLIALDRATGKERWKVQTSPADLSDPAARAIAEKYKAKDAGLAAATPVTDGSMVYLVLASGIVRALGLDGTPKWIALIDAEQNTSYGRSASPVLAGGRLYVHMTNLYAFDPATGKQLWMNAEAKCTYGTPLVLKDVVVTSGGEVVRVADGKGINTGVGPAFHTTPVEQGGILYFGDKQARAVRLDAAFKDTDLWSGDLKEDVFGSPLVHDGLFFGANGRGELFAFDDKGNAVISARPLFGEDAPKDSVYSSLTLAGNYLFLNSNPGEMVVLEATREAKLVARNKLGEGSGASPVFSGRDLFLRDGDRLHCIRP